MNKEKKVGFYYTYDANWLGGVYYKSHLINALINAGCDKITVYTDSKSQKLIENIVGNKNVVYQLFDIPVPKVFFKMEEIFRRRFSISLIAIFKRISFKEIIVFDYKEMGILRNVPLKNRVYWIPDLQDRFLPNLFTNYVLIKKNKHYLQIAETAFRVVLSSWDSYNSFKELYPQSNRDSLKVKILRFTVTHPVLNFRLLPDLLKKYTLSKYFIVSNQFMAHKNHKIVLNAVAYLIKRTATVLPFKIVMTGRTDDPRDGEVYKDFYKLALELGVMDYFVITGVIPREDQLLLMHGAISLIQPSFFEGWNSSIEDAKAIKLNLICSNLEVHKEQLEHYNGVFFNPNDHVELGDILLEKGKQEIVLSDNPDFDYNVDRRKFQKELLQVFQ